MSFCSFYDWNYKLNKQADLRGRQNFILCLHVADPATFLASNSVLGPYFPLRAACLFSNGKSKYFRVCVITSLILYSLKTWLWISSPKLHTSPLKIPENWIFFGVLRGGQTKQDIWKRRRLGKSPEILTAEKLTRWNNTKWKMHIFFPNKFPCTRTHRYARLQRVKAAVVKRITQLLVLAP